MRLNIYSIYDTAAQVFMHPMFQQADGQAVRTFSDLAVNAEHPVGQHPECYSLFRIGTYNDQNGELVPEVPEKLITGLEAVSASRKVNQDRQAALTAQINGEDHAEVGNDAQLRERTAS